MSFEGNMLIEEIRIDKDKQVRCERCGILLINTHGVSQVITHICNEEECPSTDILNKMGKIDE